MNLIELAHKAQRNMRKEKYWAKGVSLAMKWLTEKKDLLWHIRRMYNIPQS